MLSMHGLQRSDGLSLPALAVTRRMQRVKSSARLTVGRRESIVKIEVVVVWGK